MKTQHNILHLAEPKHTKLHAGQYTLRNSSITCSSYKNNFPPSDALQVTVYRTPTTATKFIHGFINSSTGGKYSRCLSVVTPRGEMTQQQVHLARGTDYGMGRIKYTRLQIFLSSAAFLNCIHFCSPYINYRFLNTPQSVAFILQLPPPTTTTTM